MKIIKARFAGATALAVAVGIAGTAVPTADAQRYNVPKPVTIKAVAKGKKLKFTGPSKVQRNAKLTIVNTTKTKKYGPHTFTLAKPSAIPSSKAEWKECEDLAFPLCANVAKAHKVDVEGNFDIRKPDVDVGKKGWDKSFGKKGDTYFSFDKGDDETRKVTAKVGTKLTFVCIVHPKMDKTLKVVK